MIEIVSFSYYYSLKNNCLWYKLIIIQLIFVLYPFLPWGICSYRCHVNNVFIYKINTCGIKATRKRVYTVTVYRSQNSGIFDLLKITMHGRTSYRIRRSRNDTAKSLCCMDQIINEYAVVISSPQEY